VNRRLQSYWPYYLLTALVMLPLLTPGYILTLDAVFVPQLRAPTAVTSDFLWQWALHLLNSVVPSQLIEKLIFTGILLGAAIGMHQLIRSYTNVKKAVPAVYAGAAFYAVNPFIYERFMAGQYGLLMGYALLPWAARAWLQFADTPARREGLRVLLLLLAISILSLPTLGEAALIGCCVLAASGWQLRRRPARMKQLLAGSAAVGVLFALLSIYWLLPALLGKGATATEVAGFTAAHAAAFATAGGSGLAKLVHVFNLQGFWAETHQLFMSPQGVLPGWGTARLAVWALVATGAFACWRQSRRLAAVFGALGVSAAVLAAGAFPHFMTRIGYREPQKFAGLLALVFAVFLACGVARLLGWARARSEGWRAAAVFGVLLVLLLFTPTMYWGFAGQLHPRQYPPGWFAANRYLQARSGGFQTVFLPWHQYMSFDFAGRIIASPAPRFFDQPVIASNDPELGRIQPPAGETATRIGTLVRPGHQPADLAKQLAGHNVRYIILAKDYDFRRYTYLDASAHIRLVRDYGSLKIYENTEWRENNATYR
jgi:hypothetical protein